MSENLLLEYANGFQGADLGWGRLNAGNLEQILRLHTAYTDLMRRTPALARPRGSNLLAHVFRSLEQAQTGQAASGALGRPGDAVLMIAGHDTNQSNLSGMLGLSWKLPGYPADDTPPGGALIFSLWQDPGDGRSVVRTRYLAQTPEQMRRADRLTLAEPPALQDIRLPGCAAKADGMDCPWPAFAGVVRGALDPAFLR